MRAAAILAGAAVGLFAAVAGLAQPAASPSLDGKELYRTKCAVCHGPVGMGTGLLARRVTPAELDKRTSLPRAYVIAAARSGVGNMPAIPRGEVSDGQLGAIADYLAGPKGKP